MILKFILKPTLIQEINMKSQKINIMIVCIFSFLFSGNCYPPAPHHIIEGLVRNEQGVPIISDSIEVLAVSEDDKTVSTKVGDVYKPGVNYSIKILIFNLLT